ncbi:MAG: uracil-DNA glycosylase family protein [Acidimicrobiia bacterium]
MFGDGPRRAPLLLVGEQPGDEEDPEGEPLVGSAGRLLDRALEEAGIDRAPVYITNVVKHFKWKPKGKRRIHGKPNAEEINACRPWQRSIPPRSCDPGRRRSPSQPAPVRERPAERGAAARVISLRSAILRPSRWSPSTRCERRRCRLCLLR